MPITSQPVIEDFTVIDFSTNMLVSGISLSSFTHHLYDPNNNEVSTTINVSYVELGNGHYRASYIPNIKGTWLLVVYHQTYFPWGKNSSVEVLDHNIDDLNTIVQRILGLSQENYHIDNNIYDGSKLIFSRIRTYTDSASVGTDLNVLATYNVSTTYNPDGTLESYSVNRI